MATFDRRDPGQDAAYCDGLAPELTAEDYCYYCNAELMTVDHAPYCSTLCGVLANIDSREDYEHE